MLFYLPTREFLKFTVLLGVPFIIVIRYMASKRPYSFPYIVSLIVLLGIISGYGFLLYSLPERVEAKQIIQEGSKLVGQKRYDEAIEHFRGLESLGRGEDMQQFILMTEKEALADQLLSQAIAFHEKGQNQEALEMLEAVPDGTRSSGQARKLKKEWISQ